MIPIDPEAVKALSEPLTKLIEVVSAGFGRVYAPTDIRRRARAEGDALVIMEEARMRAAGISLRAAQTVLDKAERHQTNIESIVHEAAKRIPHEVSDVPVNQDWATRFFAECQDVGSAEMQDVWARILAQEVAAPGTFSQRSLHVVKNVSADEANLFNGLCAASFRSEDEKRHYPMVFFDAIWHRQQVGPEYLQYLRLQDAGLISISEGGLKIQVEKRFVLKACKEWIVMESTNPFTVRLGNIALTGPGQEIAAICEWNPEFYHVGMAMSNMRTKDASITKIPAGSV